MTIRVCFDTCVIIDIKKIGEEGMGDDTGWSKWLQSKEGSGRFDDLRALQYLLAMPDQWDVRYVPNDPVLTELKSIESQEFYRKFIRWGGSRAPRRLGKASSLITLDKFGFKLPENTFLARKTKSGAYVPLVPDRNDIRQLFDFYFRSKSDIFVTTDYKHILSIAGTLNKHGIIVMSPHQLLCQLTGDERPVDYIERVLYGIGLVDHPKNQ